MISRTVYIQAGISDTNSNPTDPYDGFDSVANDSDFFKWVEIGFTLGQDKIYFDNLHVTFWRYQLTRELAVTPSIQYIKDPALNSTEDSLWAYGLRLRLAL